MSHQHNRRVKCLHRIEKFGAIDIQVTPGKFYTVLSVDPVDGGVFYTIIGDDGIEVQRPSDCFRNPNSEDGKKLKIEIGSRILSKVGKNSVH